MREGFECAISPLDPQSERLAEVAESRIGRGVHWGSWRADSDSRWSSILQQGD